MRGRVSLNSLVEMLYFNNQTFRRLGDVVISYDMVATPKRIAGRNSIVVRGVHKGVNVALKCYTAPLPYGEQIYAFARELPTQLLIKPQFFAEELWVGDHYTDVGFYPWVEGRTLEWMIRKALNDHSPEALATLERSFIAAALELLNSTWRHGDLKPENIIITPEGEVRLIDCDSLYSPSLPPRTSLGTPLYSNPSGEVLYDQHIDDYAIALIVLSLEALRRSEELFEGEVMVAMPEEHKRQQLVELFGQEEQLMELLEGLYSGFYRIDNLKDLLECIARR